MRNAIIKTTACLLILVPFYSQAATLSLLPDSSSVAVGDTVTLTLAADFDTPTFGGGIDIFYDSSVLGFVSFTFDAALQDDPLLRRQPDELDGELNGIGFGSLDTLGGLFIVGEFTFVALATGTSPLTMAPNEGGLGPIPGGPNNPGPFVDTSGSELPVVTLGASVQVVPLPAAVWFFLSALGLLGAVRQKPL